jgi:hypothetical protein
MYVGWAMTKLKNRKVRAKNPTCKTNLLKIAAVAATAAKRARKETLEACTVSDSETCCVGKECVHDYDPESVVRLRKYLNKLSFCERRSFTEERTVFKGFAPGIREVAKGSRMMTYFLEPPHILIQRLDAADMQLRKRHIPCPTTVELVSVCQLGFMHLTGLARGFIYAHNKRFWQGGIATAEDRYIDAGRLPLPRNRQAPVRTQAVYWLQELSKLAMVLPNCASAFRILPYRTPQAVHAIFVREIEKQMKSHWADEAAAEHDLDGNIDPTSLVGGAQRLNHDGTSHRYGNVLLGKEGSLPTQPGVAVFSYFMTVWYNDPIAGLARCRAFMPFAKCDTCVSFRAIDLECKDLTEKKRLRVAQAAHIVDVKQERAAYYRNRLLGDTCPDEYLSMIVDGANQANHAVPHSVEKSHVSDAAWKMHLHLMGVIVHGRGTWAYTCPPHVAQGNNVTIQAIWDTLCDIMKKDGKLPPVLFLQLDNTTKQCKGKFLMAFLGLLVWWGIFKKVIVGFLPVGHTHEDIDQFFSRIAAYMRHHGAMNRTEFGFCIANSYTKNGQRPIVKHWDSVGNISDWIKPHVGKLTGLTEFRHFKIVSANNADGVREIRWMCRTSPGSTDPDDKWRGAQPFEAYVSIFPKGVPDLLADATAGRMPPCQRSAANKDVDQFAVMLEKVKKGLDALLAHLPRFTQRHHDDCMALAVLVSTPLDVPIPFNWDLEQIALFAERGEAAEPEEEFQEEESRWAHNVGDFVLIRPIDGEAVPFHLAMIKKKTTVAGRAAVRLCYFEFEMDSPRGNDRVKGCYEPSSAHFMKPWDTLPELCIHGSGIQERVKMAKSRAQKGGGYRMHIHPNSVKAVNYWVSRWADGDLYDRQLDD